MGNIQRASQPPPRAWATPSTSPATSVSTLSTQDNERLAQAEQAVLAFRNITNAFTQRLDNFENVSASQQTQLTDLSKAMAENSKRTDALTEIADSNKKTNEQLLLSMTALIQQTQLLLGNQRL